MPLLNRQTSHFGHRTSDPFSAALSGLVTAALGLAFALAALAVLAALAALAALAFALRDGRRWKSQQQVGYVCGPLWSIDCQRY